MRRAALFALMLCHACAVAELTEVVVIIEAEPRVKMRSESLTLRVTTPGGATVLENSNTPWNDGRFTLGLSPRQSHDARYIVEASALEHGGAIARARLISGFIPGETRFVRLLLEDQCLGMLSCGEGTTCRSGACVDAELDPAEFASDSELAPSTVTLVPTASASDAGAHEASRPPADASTPQADAATPQADAAPPRIDASNDAAAAPDTRVQATCKAGNYEGTWKGDFTYVGLGVETPTTIVPISTVEAPVLSLVLESDGRLSTGCVSSTMMAPPSNRPFKARLQGQVDCASGTLNGTLYGHYAVAFVKYPFTGTIAAQLAGETLRDGAWTALEPSDPENGSGGAGAGSWSATWQASSETDLDACADVEAP